MNKKILFIKIGNFSQINNQVLDVIKANFKECEVEVLDVFELYSKFNFKRLINFIYLAKEYGIDFLKRKKSRYDWKTYEIVTSYAFKQIKKQINKKVNLSPEEYLFTFQTQSLFDGSTQNIKHYVYTDSTVLANRFYPLIEMKKILKSKEWMKLERTIYSNATINFTFSINQCKSIIEDYQIDSDKVKCIFAGCQFENITIEKKDYSRKNILFIGVNWERKGGEILLEEFKKVKMVLPDATLTIIGCNPQINENGVSILGKIHPNQLKEYFMQATVYCMPSILEPFGMVYIEAMRYKLPIVALNIGAIPDFVENDINGFIHDFQDNNNINQSLIKLLTYNDLCEKFGEESYMRTKKVYNWTAVGTQMRENIQSTLNRTIK